jgi:hypothetical protein
MSKTVTMVLTGANKGKSKVLANGRYNVVDGRILVDAEAKGEIAYLKKFYQMGVLKPKIESEKTKPESK